MAKMVDSSWAEGPYRLPCQAAQGMRESGAGHEATVVGEPWDVEKISALRNGSRSASQRWDKTRERLELQTMRIKHPNRPLPLFNFSDSPFFTPYPIPSPCSNNVPTVRSTQLVAVFLQVNHVPLRPRIAHEGANALPSQTLLGPAGLPQNLQKLLGKPPKIKCVFSV